MSEDDSQTVPAIRWTWSSSSYGWLSTTFRSDGLVMQRRQYSPSSEPVIDKIGELRAHEFQRLEELAAAAMASENPADPAVEDSNPRGEAFDLQIIGAGEPRAARIARAELERHPAMVRLRKAIIRARNRAGGGYFSWWNVGMRLAIVYIALMLFMAYLAISGTRNLSRMQKEAQHLEATVTERHGYSGFDKHKYLMVRLTPIGSLTTVSAKIADSLSDPNWRASKPGAKVRVWYHPKTGQTYLEDDILRNIHDQGGGPSMFPLYFSLFWLPLTWFFSRYRSGVYPDGKEFLIHGDRVSLDGKAMPFNDSELLAARVLIRLVT